VPDLSGDYSHGDSPVPVGAVVSYEGSYWRIVAHHDPQDHPDLPEGDHDLAEVYPDGVAYDLWPVSLPQKFGNRNYARYFVRRDSFYVKSLP
jgi:hypothetical protein